MRHCLSSPAHVMGSSTQQIAGCSPRFGIRVGNCEVSTSKKISQFFGVDFVVFDFSTVDGFEVQCMAEHKGNAFAFAPITQPVPVESTFTTDDQRVLFGERFDGLAERFCVASVKVLMQSFVALLVNDAGIHLVGV